MKIIISPCCLMFILAITACQKSLQAPEIKSSLQSREDSILALRLETTILVDASKDGGTWWFPQAPPFFSDLADHQGKAIADYLRSVGYQIDELPRGAV